MKKHYYIDSDSDPLVDPQPSRDHRQVHPGKSYQKKKYQGYGNRKRADGIKALMPQLENLRQNATTIAY